MRRLSIDIETFSGADLGKVGVYRYVQDPDFSVLLFAYAFDNDPVEVVDLEQFQEIPDHVWAALSDPDVIKTAHNANFERTCIAQFLGIALPPEQWECTMVKASMAGLPLSLEMVAKVLNLEEQKMSAGKALIRYFSVPCKPTKANGHRCRNYPEHAPEKWAEFVEYCRQDVVVERDIRNKIEFFQIPEIEKRLWYLDQKINDTGILLDVDFINNAVAIDNEYKNRLVAEAIQITGLDNPNSGPQLKKWLSEETGDEIKTLNKETVPELLKGTDNDTVKRVLEIRQEMAKTSVKKYVAMVSAICADGRVRGLLQFYGANRTGRWAGRLVQVQNLPKNDERLFGDKMALLDFARETVRKGDIEMLEMFFTVPVVLSQLIRSAFVASPGTRFIPSDFSAIEARVIAWLSGERWRLQVFATHGKIYEASAAQMFKVPIESIGKGSDLRQKGKVSELALGYQGGPNALIQMGALKMGIPEEELPKLVKMWRNANPAIVKYWADVESSAIKCVRTKQTVTISHGVTFSFNNNTLFIKLPSGRVLSYVNAFLKVTVLVFFKFTKKVGAYAPGQRTALPIERAAAYVTKGVGEITSDEFEKYSLVYEGMNQETKKWERIDTYGGKLVENIVQAVARDCLAEAMLRLDAAGYKIVMHVHDEAVLEVPEGFGSIDDINRIMGETLPWAKGLPLTADSYETPYYKKD